MHSFHGHQARTGEAEVDVSDRIASHAAALLVFSNGELQELGAILVQLVFACRPVDLVNFVVATPELDEAFEAHGGGVACGQARKKWEEATVVSEVPSSALLGFRTLIRSLHSRFSNLFS